MFLQSRNKNLIVGFRPNFRIEDSRVDDIIPVSTAGCGFEVRGGIAIGDAELMKVGNELRGV